MYIAFDTLNSTYHVDSKGTLLWASNRMVLNGTSEEFIAVSDIRIGRRAKFGIRSGGKFTGTWVTTNVYDVRVIGSAYVKPDQRTVTA